MCTKILPGTIREACLVSKHYNPLTFSSTWYIIFSLEVLLLYVVWKNQTGCAKSTSIRPIHEKRPLGLEDGLNMFNILGGGNSQKAHLLLTQGFWLWLNERLLKVVICDAPNLIQFSNQKNKTISGLKFCESLLRRWCFRACTVWSVRRCWLSGSLGRLPGAVMAVGVFFGGNWATDQLLGTIKATGQPLASLGLVLVWTPPS